MPSPPLSPRRQRTWKVVPDTWPSRSRLSWAQSPLYLFLLWPVDESVEWNTFIAPLLFECWRLIHRSPIADRCMEFCVPCCSWEKWLPFICSFPTPLREVCLWIYRVWSSLLLLFLGKEVRVDELKRVWSSPLLQSSCGGWILRIIRASRMPTPTPTLIAQMNLIAVTIWERGSVGTEITAASIILLLLARWWHSETGWSSSVFIMFANYRSIVRSHMANMCDTEGGAVWFNWIHLTFYMRRGCKEESWKKYHAFFFFFLTSLR